MAYTTINDPSAHFHIELYTGNGDARNITNDANAGDFKPDLLWIKERTSTSNQMVMDSSRAGDWNRLNPNLSSAEITTDPAVLGITDGFSLSASDNGLNEDTETYVAWQWKANGGTTTTNDASATSIGDQDSVYQANTTSGFSIVTWSGSNGVNTMAHGLGAVPNVIIIKALAGTEAWGVYHHKNTSAPETDFLRLDTTAATSDSTTLMNDTAPTSTIFTVGDSGTANEVGKTYVSYQFAEKQGYSKFGKYTGNGNADGPFVYTGFKPAWLLIKPSSIVEEWRLYDNRRSPFNVVDDQLYPNTGDDEGASSSYYIDFLSNGFKILSSHGGINTNNSTNVYMAFAESPFVTSNGSPGNAG